MNVNVRKCLACKGVYLDDVDICPNCLNVTCTSRDEVPGAGKIYSFTRVHVAPEEFQDLVPYYLAIIDLDSGVRLMARVQTNDGDLVRIGAPVELVSVENGYVFALT